MSNLITNNTFIRSLLKLFRFILKTVYFVVEFRVCKLSYEEDENRLNQEVKQRKDKCHSIFFTSKRPKVCIKVFICWTIRKI